MEKSLIGSKRMDQKLKHYPPKNFPIQSKLTSQISMKVSKPAKIVKNELKQKEIAKKSSSVFFFILCEKVVGFL